VSITLLGRLAIGAVAVTVAAGIHTLWLRSQAASPPSARATLQTFAGALDVKQPSTNTFVPAYEGQTVAAGATVRAEADSKGALLFPDGSIVRLDALGQVEIRSVMPSAGDWTMHLVQQAGWSWIKPAQLSQPLFTVDTPNGSRLTSRGSEVSVLTGLDARGKTLVVIDVWSGAAEVASASGRVAAYAGQMTAIAAAAAPTAPRQVPLSHAQSQWTVFNQTMDLVPGTPQTFVTNMLAQGETTEPQSGGGGDGKSDLAFTLGSSASVYELIILDPAGREFQRFKASRSLAVSLILPRPREGAWGYRIRNFRSASDAVWWMVFSIIKPSIHTPRPFFSVPLPCDHTVRAGQVDRWTVSALDSLGTPELAAEGLPAYARFINQGEGTGTLTVTPDRQAAAGDLAIAFSTSMAGETARLVCVEHVLNPLNDSTQAAPPRPAAARSSTPFLLSPPLIPSPGSGGGPPSPDQLPTPSASPSPTPPLWLPKPSFAPFPTPTPTVAPRPPSAIPSPTPPLWLPKPSFAPFPTPTPTPTLTPTPSPTSRPFATPSPTATPGAAPSKSP
jgi:hypothetical protein